MTFCHDFLYQGHVHVFYNDHVYLLHACDRECSSWLHIILQINIQLGKEREVAKQLLKDGKKE